MFTGRFSLKAIPTDIDTPSPFAATEAVKSAEDYQNIMRYRYKCHGYKHQLWLVAHEYNRGNKVAFVGAWAEEALRITQAISKKIGAATPKT